jgi:hypothetical protein
MTSDAPGPATDAKGRVVVDPTELTMAALQREMATVQRELEMRQEMRQREHTSLRELIETRLDGMDRANTLLSETVNRTPTDVTQAVAHVQAIMDERFTSVGTQFKERDTRSEREARDNKLAVDAAFAAQEKQAVAQNEANTTAISKSETATAETIKTNQELSKSETAALAKSHNDTKIRQTEVDDDLKKRIGAIEASFAGLASSARVGAVESQLVAIASAKQGGNERVSGIYAFTGFLLVVLMIGGFLAAAGVFSRTT